MCSEKQHLLDLLRLASHELSSLLNEASRLAKEHPDRVDSLDEILNSGREAHKRALDNYTAHVLEHGCGTPAEADAAQA